MGLCVVSVPCDQDGLRIDHLDQVGADAVLVTPAHQYPLGVTMAAARRTALVEWARRRHALIIEDDYDGEFRYDRQPVGALQQLDPNRVIYVGTASKTVAPGLRNMLSSGTASRRAGLATSSVARLRPGQMGRLPSDDGHARPSPAHRAYPPRSTVSVMFRADKSTMGLEPRRSAP